MVQQVEQPAPPPPTDPNKKKIAIALVASLTTVVLVLTIAHFLRPNETQVTDVSNVDVEAGMGEIPPEDPTPMPKPSVLDFKDALVLMDHAYSVDGGPMTEAVCSESDPPFTFATLKVGDDKVVELTCLNDYMGGIAIKGEAEPPLYEKLALTFGDAGDMSDKRAWVKRTPEGLTIFTVTRWSQEDIDEEEAGNSHVECGKSVDQITVSAKDLTSSKSDFHGNTDGFVFNPPPQINSKCL